MVIREGKYTYKYKYRFDIEKVLFPHFIETNMRSSKINKARRQEVDKDTRLSKLVHFNGNNYSLTSKGYYAWPSSNIRNITSLFVNISLIINVNISSPETDTWGIPDI